MKKIVLSLIGFFSVTFLFSQSCAFRFVVTDAENSTALVGADIMENGTVVKQTTSGGEAFLTGKNCIRYSFKIRKSGYQAMTNYSAEAKADTMLCSVQLASLDLLQANVFNELRKMNLDEKKIKDLSDKLINCYKENGEEDNLTNYKKNLKAEVNKLMEVGVLTKKEVKDIL